MNNLNQRRNFFVDCNKLIIHPEIKLIVKSWFFFNPSLTKKESEKAAKKLKNEENLKANQSEQKKINPSETAANQREQTNR